ncbi:MAG: RagB/SusD family nutrient uptake outer membrane protein, partial [Bacteroidales bacterium]|nr:RagB/SusD family nutrient uptake outer membrane protein [Bacteroidales bacterium]
MKKIHIIALFLAFAGMTAACSSDFLETAPTSDVAESSIFSNTETALMAIDGIARIMHDCSSSWVSQGSYPTFCLHLVMMSDDVIYTYTHTQWKDSQNWVRHRDLTHKYFDINYYWKVFYRVISNANKILYYIDDIPGDETTRQWIKGQAYAYRAFCHLQLVQAWAQRYDAAGNNTQLGVIIRTDNDGSPKARSTVEEVYTQILSDINAGITCLESAAAFKKHDKSNIDQWVAKGIKARVLLNMGKWAEAASVAQDVVDHSGAALAVSTYTDTDQENRFGEASNSEWLWACISSRTDYSQFGGNRRCWHDHISNNPTTDNNTTPKTINALLYRTIPDTDVRKAMWLEDPYSAPKVYIAAAGKKAMFMSQKWLVDDIVTKYAERDVPYMRLPEMMLIAAEGYAKSNNPEKARQLLYDLG